MAVRIGIDVGGTFTDAVAIDNDTFELIGSVKVPTSHSSEKGVAAGIVEALQAVLEKYSIPPEEVTFIAHGTTQATNALLEGDVEKVGVIGVGKGVEGYKVKMDTQIGDIELAPNRYLRTKHYFLSQSNWENEIDACVADMRREGIRVCVVSAAYSVDDPTDEQNVMDYLTRQGISGTCGHEISKLYGLRIRTRTAVINASILPRMIQTAEMTENSVLASSIQAPLMIMRCDGGVMSVKEISKRPILTMLSGPAAGVAGALMYEKVSEGIFLEVGGTSTDISAIHNGQVMVSYAEVGGHKTYVNSLDVRTVGIAGGSIIRIDGKRVADVGPRSAHIANLPYIVYTRPEELGELEVRLIRPVEGDFPDYCSIYDKTHDRSYALTLACCANASGYVQPDNYAFGYAESAMRGFQALADHLGQPVEQVLETVNRIAAEKNKSVVLRLIEDYHLDPQQTVLIGGGGGAAAVVPYLAQSLGLKHKIARNAEVISPIGVALALVRDIVERTIPNPTDDDILMVRREAEQQALKSGASPGTIEVFVEVDARNNVVRAIATGATELKTKNRLCTRASREQILAAAEESLRSERCEDIRIIADTGDYYVVGGTVMVRKLFGLMREKRTPVRIVNSEGVIRIRCRDGVVLTTDAGRCSEDVSYCVSKLTKYSDGGEKIPQTYVIIGARLFDFSKIVNKEQLAALLQLELNGVAGDTPILAVFNTPQTS
ncbi:MAG: hydantoinase/oxoprolinase family protein [Candidatus Faecousia sp.]|nr:hydantoinase/oxoprolinase family protein [Candidatus Faecousia sp.]